VHPTAHGPAVHGRIDCLWQDESGAWRLLFWTPVSESVLTRASEAFTRQTGVAPESVEIAVALE
jgi:hypothetical protein